MFYVSVIFLPAIFVIQHLYTNIIETKFLLPLYITKEETEPGTLKGDIHVSIRMMQYGGECIDEVGNCHSDIDVSGSGVEGDYSDIS